MEKSRKDTRWMVSVALMAAIVILLANTPLAKPSYQPDGVGL